MYSIPQLETVPWHFWVLAKRNTMSSGDGTWEEGVSPVHAGGVQIACWRVPAWSYRQQGRPSTPFLGSGQSRRFNEGKMAHRPVF